MLILINEMKICAAVSNVRDEKNKVDISMRIEIIVIVFLHFANALFFYFAH